MPTETCHPTAKAPPVNAADIVAFWRRAGPELWFAKDADFDRRFRESFLDAHEAAARGDLDPWMTILMSLHHWKRCPLRMGRYCLVQRLPIPTGR